MESSKPSSSWIVGLMFSDVDRTVALWCEAVVGRSAGGGVLKVLYFGFVMSLESWSLETRNKSDSDVRCS